VWCCARRSVGVAWRGKSGLRSRRAEVWRLVQDVTPGERTWRSAAGRHQGAESGLVVSEVARGSGWEAIALAIVVGTVRVCRMVVVLLAESLGSTSARGKSPLLVAEEPLRHPWAQGRSRGPTAHLSRVWERLVEKYSLFIL